MLEKIRKNKNSLIFNLIKYNFVVILVFSLFVSVCSNNNLAMGASSSQAETNGITLETGIENPLGEKIDSIPTLIKTALDFVVKIGIPVVAFFIIYSGFKLVTAQGNKSKLEEAKKSLLNVIIGAAIVLGAFVISKAIGGTVEQIREGV